MDELRRIFNRLNLILIGEAAIRFIDPEVFRLCLSLWDIDGDGMISVAESKAIKRFGQNAFNNNGKIVTLDDLDKFENGYIYHSGGFSGMPNLVTASTGLKINLTSGLPDTFTMNYANCPKLESIKINKHITTISNNAFENDVSLKTVIWGGNETKIGNAAFKGCKGLKEIVLPPKVTSIGDEIFRDCTSLKNIQLSNMTIVGWRSFYGCTNLVIDLNMPSLETIATQAFGSTGIISASNLGVMKSLGDSSFSDCPNLRYVILPATLATIGSGVFYNCKVLEYVVCKAIVPPTMSYSVFNNTSCLIYVPDESLEIYKTSPEWNRWASRIKPISQKTR